MDKLRKFYFITILVLPNINFYRKQLFSTKKKQHFFFEMKLQMRQRPTHKVMILVS